MAFLTSSATLAEVVAQYENTAHYDLPGGGGVAAAQEHVQACRILIGRTVDETRQGGGSVRDNATKYRDSANQATEWLRINDPDYTSSEGGGVRHYSFENLRG